MTSYWPGLRHYRAVAPGVVYTTFHHPLTHANIITTDFSDWATNCPEYKVTQLKQHNGINPNGEHILGMRGGWSPERRLSPDMAGVIP